MGMERAEWGAKASGTGFLLLYGVDSGPSISTKKCLKFWGFTVTLMPGTVLLGLGYSAFSLFLSLHIFAPLGAKVPSPSLRDSKEEEKRVKRLAWLARRL